MRLLPLGRRPCLHSMSLIIFWLLCGLLCIALLYYFFSVYAAWRFFRPRRGSRPVAPPYLTTLPPVTILKPLKGAPSDLYDSLASFCRLDYPTFQIMCGVRDPNDPAIAIVTKVQHDFPQCDITLVVEPQVIGTNYKVSSLHHLTPQMKYDYLVITDSDVCVEPNYLRTIIPPLTSPETGLVTCVYRGGSAQPLPALLESLMINTVFTPQVVVASQVEQPSYAFGATMALKRTCLEAIGGFARLSDYLADDYYLGYLIAQAGYQIRVLPTVVETRPDAGSLSDLFHHQLRWARTQRNCRPSGYISTCVTFGTVWAYVGLLCFWSSVEMTILALSVIGVRLLTAALTSTAFLQSTLPLPAILLTPLTDLLSFVIWCVSLQGDTVQWREYTFRVHKDGRMVRVS